MSRTGRGHGRPLRLPTRRREATGTGVDGTHQLPDASLASGYSGLIILLPLAAAVLYLTWLVEPLVGGGLDPVRSYVSELSADGQPWARAFRAGDALSGGLISWWAISRARAASGALAIAGWVGLAVFGVATVADAAFPLSCTPTHDPACRADEAAGLVPLHHSLHTVTSVVAGFALALATVLLTAGQGRRSPGVVRQRQAAAPDRPLVRARAGRLSTRPSSAWTPMSLLVPACGYLLGTGWTLWEVARLGTDPNAQSLVGAAQRLQVASAALWLLALGLTGRRDAPSARAHALRPGDSR